MNSRTILLALLLITIPAAEAITELDEGIGLMLLGDVGRAGSPINNWLDRDLIIDYFEIPMAQKSMVKEDLIKYTNLYFPRTLEHLVDIYDMIVICEEEELFAWYTSPRHQEIMYRAVKDEGVALFNSLPHEHYEVQEWADTRLSETMPHDYEKLYIKVMRSWTLEINEDPNLPPVFTPFIELGIEKYQGPHLGRIYKKPGATTWARAVPINAPFFISWEYGEKKARTSVTGHDLDEAWWGSTYRGSTTENPWGGDLFLNIVYWSVGKDPITDISIVRAVRDEYANFLMQRGVTLSLVDFIDDFGASVAPLEQELREITKGRAVAKRLYFEQDYDGALQHLQSMFKTMENIETEALELKKKAFLWIYVIEWSVVTASLMVVGFITWSLMVRRRLYRKVEVTRTQSSGKTG